MREKRRDMCYLFWPRAVHGQFVSEFLCRSFEKVAWKLSGQKTSAGSVEWSSGESLRWRFLLGSWITTPQPVQCLPVSSLATGAVAPASAAVLSASLLGTEHLMSDFFRVLTRYHASHLVFTRQRSAHQTGVFWFMCILNLYPQKQQCNESGQKCLKQHLMKKVGVTFPTDSLSVSFSSLSVSKKTLFWQTQPLHTHFLEHCV